MIQAQTMVLFWLFFTAGAYALAITVRIRK